MPYPLKNLSEVCEKITDGTHQTPTYFNQGVIFLSSKNVTSGKIDWKNIKYIDERQHQEMSKRVSPKLGDILLAKNGTTGVAALVDREEVFDIYVSLALLRPKNIIDNYYLLYFINSSQAKKQFNSRLKGVGVPNLHLREIKEVEIPLPPLPTQKTIVQKLDEAFARIDASIELAEKSLKAIEEGNASVLEEVFGSGEYEEKEIGVLTEKNNNWNPQIIGEVFFDYIDISSIDNKNFTLKESKKIKGTDAPSRAKQLVLKDDILFATTRPNLKNIAKIGFDIEHLTCSTGFCILRAKVNILNPDYLFYFLITDLLQDQITPFIRGAQYPAISDKDLKNIKLPLPPLSKQKEIVEYLDRVFAVNAELKGEYVEKIASLKELKQSLLREAFEGRLVRD